ncbi:tetratricopeptide repeat protein [Actinosynnema mirum]|uniref:tetratricopeptide repeat protein n=1 Tax=Actinosynnema mirum TaxID=40567 RepID=UPI00019AC6C0|nr:tetratricopeptide repeat protein [Actinosynnema mirum]
MPLHSVQNRAHAESATIVQVGSIGGNVSLHGAGHSRPRQVPAPPSGFVNRESELSSLGDALLASPEAHGRVVVLTGLSGMGKSAVVRRWVAAEGHRFPGGQLHVDLATMRSGSEAPVSDALVECLLALGIGHEHIPTSLAGRANVFRSSTAGHPVLVVLDGVTEPAQVPPFTPNSGGSAVLVTSQDRLSELALDGARHLSVGPMDRGSGTSLLRAVCGPARLEQDPDAASSLVELCGGYPLALRIIASRLMTRPRMALAELVGELVDEGRRLDALSLRGARPVTRVLDNTYRNLNPLSARLYRRLGTTGFPSFTFDVVVVLLEADQEQAHEALAGLVEASMVDPSEDGHRFSWHDLVRLHAARRAADEDSPEEREAVLARIGEHLSTKAALADEAVMGKRTRISTKLTRLIGTTNPFSGPSGAADALEWLVVERANLLRVLRAMHSLGWHSAVWELAEALMVLYFNRRYTDDWLVAGEIGVASANAGGAPEAEARLRSVVSRAYVETDELELAKSHLDVALRLAEESGNKVLIASVWEFIGRYREKVDVPSAIAAYRHAIARNDEAGEKRGSALAMYFMGCAMSSDENQQQEALDVLLAAHRMFVSINDPRMANRAQVSLGTAYFRSGDLTAAHRELEQAVRAFSESGATHYESQAREALAVVAEHEGDVGVARENLERVVEIRRASGAPDVAGVEAEIARLSEPG